MRQSHNERVLRAAREGVRVRVRHKLSVQHGVPGFRRAAGHVFCRIGRRTRGRRAGRARERRTGAELYRRRPDDGLRSADTAGGRRRGRPVLARGSRPVRIRGQVRPDGTVQQVRGREQKRTITKAGPTINPSL